MFAAAEAGDEGAKKLPVAVIGSYQGHRFQYVLTDHLGTPRAVVNPPTNAIIWRWDLTGIAFGNHARDANPDGDGANYVFNLRYPGQYYDGESGLHYNYFRDYDPATGRYVQSDPIGLGGGISTYGYVSGHPFGSTDPYGLWDVIARYSNAGTGHFSYQFSFQTSKAEVLAVRYGDDVGGGLAGRLSRWLKAFAEAMGGIDHTAAIPAGMSDLSIDDALLDMCIEWDSVFEDVYERLGHRPNDWLSADQANSLLEAFRSEVDNRMRSNCQAHQGDCIAPYRAIKSFYGLGNDNVDKMLSRARGRMDSTSNFVLRNNPPQ